ncbi:MAG: AmmeMemoRadiSam system protein A [Gemmatimonadaceae bacterium]
MTPDQGRILLELARAAIAQAFGGPKVKRPAHDGWLDAPAAVFVTLHRQGELRGCIGSLEAHHSLFHEVLDKARAAAFEDTRMIPVRAEELPELDIEISVLHPLEPIAVDSQDELLRQLRPGVDGLVLRSREGSALFLPSVWKELPDRIAFVRHLMQKARLTRWPADMRAYRFTTDVVSPETVEA